MVELDPVTLRCPACRSRVPDRADACPGCGRPVTVLLHDVDAGTPAGPSPRSLPERLGRWRGRLATLAVVGTAWALLWLAPVRPGGDGAGLPEGPGEPAQAAATGCTGVAPYVAYDAGRRFYPPAYPGPLPEGRPDRCFPTAEDAAAAGFRVAPPPPGWVVVEGVYLGPVDLTAGCRRGAARVGFAVPCPTLLPHPSPGAPATCPSANRAAVVACAARGVFLLEQREVSGDVVTSSVVLAFPSARGPGCRRAEPAGRTQVRFPAGRDGRYRLADFERCPDPASPHAGRLVLTWSEGAITYQASLEGPERVVYRVLPALASSMRLVRPSPAR